MAKSLRSRQYALKRGSAERERSSQELIRISRSITTALAQGRPAKPGVNSVVATAIAAGPKLRRRSRSRAITNPVLALVANAAS